MSPAEAGPASSPPYSERNRRDWIPFSALDPQSPANLSPFSPTFPKESWREGEATRGKARAAWATSDIHTQALPISSSHNPVCFGLCCLFRIYTPKPKSSLLAPTAFFPQNGLPGRPPSDLLMKAHTAGIPLPVLCSLRGLASSSVSPCKREGWCLVPLPGRTLHPARAAPSPPSPASVAELGGGPHSCP